MKHPSLAAKALQQSLATQLPLMGHRNWIAITDAAYPLQTQPGITTLNTKLRQLDAIKLVLSVLEKSDHVRPLVYRDVELDFLTNEQLPEIQAFRDKLTKILRHSGSKAFPHDEIIAKLDEAGKQFNVLVIKTDSLLPYTSIFLQLECAYWDADREKKLQHNIKKENEVRALNGLLPK
jgi:L-fucose mutarotase/ribose pyranase (RbsD/FucU family)